jgi:hypothetical protein
MRGTLFLLTVAAGLTFAVPAVAEDFYVGGPGFGVGVDTHHHYRDRDWDSRRYRTEGFDRDYSVSRCRTTVIRHSDGSVRKVRRCRD